MDYKRLFNSIEKELLKDENICQASVDIEDKTVTIMPVQNKQFFTNYEPLENFLNEAEEINIHNVQFKIREWDHFNTTIYKIVLEMADTNIA